MSPIDGMLALEEKARTVMLLAPDLVLAGRSDDIAGDLDELYIEVKARKQVYITFEDADSFFHYLPAAQRGPCVEAFTRGLTEVLVLEHLDGVAIEKASAFCEEKLKPAYGDYSCYSSGSSWEAMRDLEFFFPYLDALPVERTLVMVKPDGLQKGAIEGHTLEEQIESEAAAAGLLVVGKVRMTLEDAEAKTLCKDLEGTEDFQGSVGVLRHEPGVLAMCVEGAGAIGKAMLMCGPSNSGVAKDCAPTTLRAMWGTDRASNAVHASTGVAAAAREIECLFKAGDLKMQRTLCIVKPHAMKDLLHIRMELEASGFTVLKEKHTELTEERAKEFYRDRKALPTFDATVREAIAGKCACLVLCRLEAVSVLQQLMGPEVVKDAQALRPRSLRARYGLEGQRNALHGSEGVKSAAREVRFFFPEMGSDPVPGDDEVRDFLFRKSAAASMDLKSLSSMDATDYTLDPTMQQMISSGLLALCQVRPKGLAAVNWFKEWLVQNNPNSDKKKAFLPPDRNAAKVQKPKKVIDVDVSEERETVRVSDFKIPPYVVLVLGEVSHCQQLVKDLNFLHLDVPKMLEAEVTKSSRIGTEIMKHRAKKEAVPDALIFKMLREYIKKNGATNRFLLSGLESCDKVVLFEQEVATVSFVLNVSASEVAAGEQDVVDYYGAIGRVRTVDGTSDDKAAVYSEVKKVFNCRFLYLMGPPGVPMAKVAARLEARYGYSCIDLAALLRKFADSGEPDAAKVKAALAKGKPIEASIACPLVLKEIQSGLALGVQNYVICDCPQILKQREFLEYRVPCTSRPLLLDFSRADAEEMAAMMATGSAEAEVRTHAFFSEETQAMIRSLPNLVRIPFSLEEMQGYGAGPSTLEGLEAQLVDKVWGKVCEKVVPGLTLCLGLPSSGTNLLAPLVASRAPGTCVVDCNQLLDKEMDRKTEVGVKMSSMLSQGQVVPLSMTIQLLKDILNLTCSDSLVLENCPVSVEQIDQLAAEFRIDKALYISGDEKVTAALKEKFIAKCKGEDPEEDAKRFKDCKQRLAEIVTTFGRLGKLERLEVTEAPTKDSLVGLLDQATLPQFIVVAGLSTQLTPRLAELVAKSLGASGAVTADMVPAKDTPEETFLSLRQHVESTGSSLVVLDRFITGDAMAKEFVEYFGAPKLIVDVSCEAEFIEEEFKAANEEMEEEAAAEAIEKAKTAYEAVIAAFSEQCPSSMLKLEKSAMKAPAEEPLKAADEMLGFVKQKLLPTVYVVVAPSGEADFAGEVGDQICTTIRTVDSGRPLKMTVFNAAELPKPSGHSAEIEEKILRVQSSSPGSDGLPASLWTEIYAEAFAKAVNPMGPFLVTNFPAASSGAGGPTVRDQFCILEGLATLGGILHVQLSDDAFTGCVSESAADLAAYRAFDSQVLEQTQLQFDKERICAVPVQGASGKDGRAKAAFKACSDFLAFLAKPQE